MSKRKIGEIIQVNHSTGEVTSHRSLWSNRYSERFLMFRLTDGLDWYYSLSKNGKSLFVYLHDISDSDSMRVSLTVCNREYICSKLDIARRQLSLLLNELVVSDCIFRLSQNDFVVNPSYLFKCSLSDLQNKIDEYDLIKRGLYVN